MTSKSIARRKFGELIRNVLEFLAIILLIGAAYTAYKVTDIFGATIGIGIPLFIMLLGLIGAVQLLALAVSIDLLADIRASTKSQERMLPSLLGTINNSILGFQAAYLRKTTVVELVDVDDTEDNGD